MKAGIRAAASMRSRAARHATSGGACHLCEHFLASGHSRRLTQHLHDDHWPSDFVGLSPMMDR